MKVLIFDTETTGLPQSYNTPLHETSKWPHILQLSFILYNHESKQVEDYIDHIIKIGDNVIISPESMAIHKITYDDCRTKGIPIEQALSAFEESFKNADILIGHNIMFDKQMLTVEMNRNQIPNLFHTNRTKFVSEYCTMKHTTNLCAIQIKNKKTGRTYNKYPKLSELHEYLFQTTPVGTHNAMTDVLICLRCYIKLEYDTDLAIDPHTQPALRSLITSCGS